jgi:hypothetical protein
VLCKFGLNSYVFWALTGSTSICLFRPNLKTAYLQQISQFNLHEENSLCIFKIGMKHLMRKNNRMKIREEFKVSKPFISLGRIPFDSSESQSDSDFSSQCFGETGRSFLILCKCSINSFLPLPFSFSLFLSCNYVLSPFILTHQTSLRSSL